MGGHPGLEIVIVVLVVPEDRHQARKGRGRDQCEERRGSPAIIQPCAGNQDRDEEPQRVHQDMALTALHLLAAVISTLGAPLSVVLTDWLSIHTALGVGSRPAATRVCSRNAWTIRVQVPSSRHWAK